MNIVPIPNGYLNENTYAIQGVNTNDCILIDPGFDFALIEHELAKQHLEPKHILITHGHFDHTYSVDEFVNSYDIKNVFIHESDSDFPYDAVKNSSYWHNSYTMQYKDVKKFKNNDILNLLGIKFTCLNLKGHTPGSTFFAIEDSKIMFTGDTLIKKDLGITHLYGGDRQQLLKTAYKIYQMPKEYIIYPGHGPFSSIEYEIEHNKYLRIAWEQYKQKILEN